MGYSQFGKNFKAIREDHGLSQYEVADKLQVTQNTIGSWETRGGKPRSRQIEQRIVDRSVISVYGREDDRYRAFAERQLRRVYIFEEIVAFLVFVFYIRLYRKRIDKQKNRQEYQYSRHNVSPAYVALLRRYLHNRRLLASRLSFLFTSACHNFSSRTFYFSRGSTACAT